MTLLLSGTFIPLGTLIPTSSNEMEDNEIATKSEIKHKLEEYNLTAKDIERNPTVGAPSIQNVVNPTIVRRTGRTINL